MSATTTETTAASSTDRPSRRRLRMPRSTFGRHALIAIVGLVVVAAVLELTGPFFNFQLATMSYYAIAAVGLTVLTGLNGQISLGHGALMAVGAYTTALLVETGAVPLLPVLLIAALVTVVVGAIVGVAAARLHGPYLAGATLALAVAVPALAIYFDDVFGGEQGLTVESPEVPDWFADAVYFVSANETTPQKYLAYLGWALLIIVMVLLSNLMAGRLGRVWRAVRDDEVAAELAGIRLGQVRVTAFVVSAACAGLAGAVLGLVVRLAAPTGFSIVLSLGLLTAVVVGGLGSLPGALLGSAILVFLPPTARDIGIAAGLDGTSAAQLAPFVYGVVLVLVILLAPAGVAGFFRRITSRISSSRRSTSERTHK